MPPVPVVLAFAIGGTIPIDVGTMPLLPIHTPGAIFVLVERVIILVTPIVEVMAVVLMIIMIPVVISVAVLRDRPTVR